MAPTNAEPIVDARRLALALLILRVSLGVFLFLWGVEKLVIPERTVGIYGKYYDSISCPYCVSHGGTCFDDACVLWCAFWDWRSESASTMECH